MSERIVLSSPLIESIYSQSSPSEPIDLGQVAVQFDYKGTTYHDLANIVMRFVPNERLEVVCPLKDKPPMFGLELFAEDGGSGSVPTSQTIRCGQAPASHIITKYSTPNPA
jgi:hypothetical protein